MHRSSQFPIATPHLSFQLWLSSLSFYLSLLCFTISFLVSISVTFCLSSRPSLPPVSPFLVLYFYFLLIWPLSLSLSIFSHDHPNYFKFSVIPTSAISQDWHLVTDDSVTMLWCSWFYKVRTLGWYPAHLEYHVMDFRQCLILWSVLSFFVSRALAQLWNALAGQVQMVQFSDFAVLFTPHCVYHPEWFQIKI